MLGRLLLAALLLSFALTLHTQTHEATTLASSYLPGLVARQNSLTSALTAALQDYRSVTSSIVASGAYTSTQISTTQNLVNSQRLALTNLTNYINVPLNPPPCNSTATSIAATKAMKKEAGLLKSALLSFRTSLVNCVNCVITSQINQLILEQQNVIQVVDQIVASSCTVAPPLLQLQNATGLVNLGLSRYKNNLIAKNWIYGNITATQYKFQMFAESIKYNLTSCPLSKPYVNTATQICFNCPPGMNYSLGQKTCLQCPAGEVFSMVMLVCMSPCNATSVFNTTTKTCQPIPVAPTNSLCPINTPVFNTSTLTCQACPSATPLYNSTNNTCLACPINTNYDALLAKCVTACASGQFFDPIVGACAPIPVCPSGTVFNSTLKQCILICPNGTLYSNITKKCVSQVPHNCSSIKPVWNTTTLQCELCPQATPVWNATIKQCQPCPASAPVFNYTSFSCGPQICSHGYKWNPNLLRCSPLNKTCPLPNQGYVFLMQKCVPMCATGHTYYPQNNTCSCLPSLPVFNTTTRTCQAPLCPSGTKWNTLVAKCVTLNSSSCNTSQFYNFTAGGCVQVCPPNIPYIKASNACNCTAQYPTFNFTTRTCVAPVCTNPPNSKWNTFLLKCVPLNGNCSAWQVYNFTTEFCVTVCPSLVPYIKSNNTCNCTPQMPYFNTTDRYCQAPVCPLGFLWNSFLLRCVQVNMTCLPWQAYDFKLAKCINMCQVNQTYYPKYHNCSCPKATPFYNKTLKNCTIPPCPNNTKWNPLVLSCVPLNKTCLSWQQWNFTNASCLNVCITNQTYFPANKTCTCPKNIPYYNSTLKNCTIPPCPNATKWNPTLLNCTLLNSSCPHPWMNWTFVLGKCVAVCPINTTFVYSTGNCTCPPAFPVFDNVTRKCLEPVCPNGTLWDRFLLKCANTTNNCSAWQHFNFRNQTCVQVCPINVTYYSRANICLCPPSAPLYNATNHSCLIPNCSAGYKYNAYLVKCSPLVGNCSAWQAFNFTNQTCIQMCHVNHTYFPKNNSCSCNASYPLYNKTTKNCTGLPCGNGTKWNPSFQKCAPLMLPCHIWQQFNFTLQACENVCPVNHTFYPNNNSCQCFPSAPLFDPVNRTCVIPNCTNGTRWDPYLKKCVNLTANCSSWQAYNFTLAKCVNMCFVGQLYHPTTKACQCPPEVPYWDNKTKSCIMPKCPHLMTYNVYLMKCSPLNGKCAIWQYYDFTTQSCVTRCQVGHQYIKANDTCHCFPFQPYFNTTSRLCQIPPCPAGTVWNTNLLKCQSLTGHCLPNQLYNFTDALCHNMCPVNQTYFPSNNSCSCYPSHPIFNPTTRLCQIPVCLYGQTWSTTLFRCKCASGHIFNSTSNLCQPICTSGSAVNFTINICQPICGANMFVNSSNKCHCNPGYVFNPNGLSCRLPCPPGTAFSVLTFKCQIVCNINEVYNNIAKKCECIPGFVVNVNGPGCRLKCPVGQQYNSTSFICQPICGSHMFINSSNKCQCLLGFKPSPTLVGCVSQCTAPLKFNPASGTCQPVCGGNMFINSSNQCQCNNGYKLDPAGTACILIVCSPGFVYNSLSLRCQPTCGANMFVNSTNQCQCGGGYVLNPNGVGCHVSCASGFVYNATINNCQPVCAANMFVNVTNQCQCNTGYILNLNGIGCRAHCAVGFFYSTTALTCQKVVCQAGYQFNPINKICEKTVVTCPSGTFYNKLTKTCESCPTGYTFNPATNTCQVGIATICPAGYTFNPTTKLCDLIVHNCPAGQSYSTTTKKCENIFITSPSAGNLLTTNMANYTTYYNAQKAANPALKNCGGTTPFYDPVSRTCVGCPGTHPYFNLGTSHCQNCGSQLYNSATFSCVPNPVNKVTINPTIGRFVSNVF